MADVIKLKDGDVRPVAGTEDALKIIKEKLGDEISFYLLGELAWRDASLAEYTDKIEEYEDLVKEYNDKLEFLTEAYILLDKAIKKYLGIDDDSEDDDDCDSDED